MKQAGEGAPTPHEAEALELGEAEAPSIAEATEAEAEAPQTSNTEVIEVEASRTTEAGVAEVGLSAAKPATQEAEMEAGQASIPPPVQDL